MTIAETIAAAKAAAAANTGAGLPATMTPDYTPPATQAPHKMSLAELADSGGLQVDGYLSVGKEGMRVGKDLTVPLIEELLVTIDFDEVAPTFNARGEVGGSVRYVRSGNGVTSSSGKPYTQELEQLRKLSDPAKFIEYQSAEIPLVLLAPVKNKKGDVAYEQGATIGFTPAERNGKIFMKFIKDTMKKVPDLVERGPVKVKLTFEQRQGAQAYGVALFSLVLD